MYPLLIVAVLTFLAYIIGDLASNNITLIKSYQLQKTQIDMQLLSDNVSQYYLEKNAYPSSLSALALTPGYEHIKSSQNFSIGLIATTNLNDTVWNYSRAVLGQFNPQNGESISTVTALNSCGTGNATVAMNWCGSTSQYWERKETREFYNAQLAEQRVRQQRMISKFAAYFNDIQKLPNKDQSSVSMTAGQSYSMTTLAGYGGTSTNCSGTYTWMGIPIDCGDMFDRWGNSILYHYFSDSHIALVSSTSIKNSAGSAINIATDIDIN